MLDVKELRIGNYVDHTPLFNKLTYLVKGINRNYIEGVEYKFKDNDFGIHRIETSIIEPIPLTEEWLIKFGFESDPYQDRYILVTDNGEFIVHCNKTKGYLELWIDLSLRTVDLKTVHQTQNLFYELGEELTIK